MKRHALFAACSAGLLLQLTCCAAAQEKGTLIPQLEPLRPFLAKTWRGEMKGSTPDKPVVDVSRWERALNGQAIRVLHSVNDGAYGGETMIYWDKEKQQITYRYFTTAGFQTHGTFTFSDGKISSIEKVTGDANGVTEVRATSEVRPDGSLFVRAEYFKEGKWTPGRETTYKEDSKAEVKFK